MPGVSPERFRGALNNFRLGAADVGYQRLRRQCGTEPPDEIEDRDHGCCQYHQIAAAHGIGRIGGAGLNGAAVLSLLQHRSAIAPDDSSGEPAFLEGKAERASDQAGSDDGDLFERHDLLAFSSRAERGISSLPAVAANLRAFRWLEARSRAIPSSCAAEEVYAISRPTAGAIMRSSSMSLANCSGYSDCAPSESALSG